ncbi:MAG: alanine racemase, partial [Proteobacteria bacterium]|nr:alanine racemase [Pseudomonadota bacterium]
GTNDDANDITVTASAGDITVADAGVSAGELGDVTITAATGAIDGADANTTADIDGDVATLADNPRRLAGIEVKYVMSHLASADEPANPLNARQLAAFNDARAQGTEAAALFEFETHQIAIHRAEIIAFAYAPFAQMFAIDRVNHPASAGDCAEDAKQPRALARQELYQARFVCRA